MKINPQNWFHAPYTSSSSPIVIGGCGRSGTTLLRVILDTHSHIASGPESHLFLSPIELQPNSIHLLTNLDISPTTISHLIHQSTSHAQFIDKFFATYAHQNHKTFWAEKTPKNVHALQYIFHHFPQAHFIHVIRDGRDAICSLRHHMNKHIVQGKIITTNHTNPLSPCIHRWLQDTQAGLTYRHHPHYHEIHYEDLVHKPQSTLTSLLENLGFSWEPQLLNFFQVTSPSRNPLRFPQNPEATRPIFTSSVGRWHRDLSPQELHLVLSHTQPLLHQLDYL